jgi:hypothetical protein
MHRSVLEILGNRQATIDAYDTERGAMEGHDAPGEIDSLGIGKRWPWWKLVQSLVENPGKQLR